MAMPVKVWLTCMALNCSPWVLKPHMIGGQQGRQPGAGGAVVLNQGAQKYSRSPAQSAGPSRRRRPSKVRQIADHVVGAGADGTRPSSMAQKNSVSGQVHPLDRTHMGTPPTLQRKLRQTPGG